MSEGLSKELHSLIGSVYGLYFISHQYHWNVEDKNFSEYHTFLGDLYEEVFDSIDTLAELIRTINDKVNILTSIYDGLGLLFDSNKTKTNEMFTKLISLNSIVIDRLNKSYKIAEKENELAVCNYLQDRLQAHKKHEWMLKSFKFD